MLLFSSVGSIGSRTFQSARHQQRSEDDDDDGGSGVASSSEDASVYKDSHEDLMDTGDLIPEEDGDSYGGTILASLTSKEVCRNLLETELFCSSEPLVMAATRKPPQPLSGTHKTLNEIATVQSEPLSFTPTMAERVLSGQSKTHEDTPKSVSGSEAMSTFGITDVQPERVACPFCDHEKDLQWRLSKDREELRDLKLSEYKTRFLLFALIVGIVSFFLGKTVSDMQSEKVLAQYMRQCNDMVHQKEDEDLYWKLVTAAFSAMINGLAGPLADFVLKSATQSK